MKASQVAAVLRRQELREAALAARSRRAQQRGDQRHQALDEWVAANAVRIAANASRIAALEARVASLEAALAAHQSDDKRHTGKLGGVV